MARRENLTCDICNDDIATSKGPIAAAVVGVIITLTCRAEALELTERNPREVRDNGDGTLTVELHAHHHCAGQRLRGCGPIEVIDADNVPSDPGGLLVSTRGADDAMAHDPKAGDGGAAAVVDRTTAVPNPKLQHLRRFVNVLVGVAGHTVGSVEVYSPSTRAACQGAPGSPHGQDAVDLIEWPVGTQVRLLPSRGKPVIGRVEGYVVKSAKDLSWDTPTPRCGLCDKPTEHGERVTVREAGPDAYDAICKACSEKAESA